jgi:hypothetical protein
MRRESELKQQVLELQDIVLKLQTNFHPIISQFPETDGYDFGTPSDYEDNLQLELFDE